LNEKYEDIFCQYTIFEDINVVKTEVVRGTHNPDFKHSKNFSFLVTPKLLDNLMNKSFYIQIWGEQKHPKPDVMNSAISTKEYFEREKESGGLKNTSNFVKDRTVDPEKERLEEELHLANVKEKRSAILLDNVQKLIQKANSVKKTRVPIPVLIKVVETLDQKELARIIDRYATEPEEPGNTIVYQQQQPQQLNSDIPMTTTICNIL